MSLRRGGREPELDDPEVLAWIGRLMARIHVVGAAGSYIARPALDVDSFGETPRHWLLAQDLIPADLRDSWSTISAQALDAIRRCYDRAGDVQSLRLHGDCHAGNLLWTDAGPHFVDFDDSRTGPAIQDLWMLLGGHRRDRQSALHALMDGYETVCDFDWREWRLVEALRTLRLIHHSAWLARRWDDPAFPAAFPWFAQASYWQQQADQLRQQIEWMQQDLEPPMA